MASEVALVKALVVPHLDQRVVQLPLHWLLVRVAPEKGALRLLVAQRVQPLLKF
jgi:hypothetical protein